MKTHTLLYKFYTLDVDYLLVTIDTRPFPLTTRGPSCTFYFFFTINQMKLVAFNNNLFDLCIQLCLNLQFLKYFLSNYASYIGLPNRIRSQSFSFQYNYSDITHIKRCSTVPLASSFDNDRASNFKLFVQRTIKP